MNAQSSRVNSEDATTVHPTAVQADLVLEALRRVHLGIPLVRRSLTDSLMMDLGPEKVESNATAYWRMPPSLSPCAATAWLLAQTPNIGSSHSVAAIAAHGVDPHSPPAGKTDDGGISS